MKNILSLITNGFKQKIGSFKVVAKDKDAISYGMDSRREFKRKEVVENKDSLDLLATQENAVKNGFYSKELGFLSLEHYEQLVRLNWSSYCTEEYLASWIEFNGSLNPHSVEYAIKFFFD